MLVGTDHPWRETGNRAGEAQSHQGHRHQTAQHRRTQDQAPLDEPRVSGCYPSWDGGFVGFETVLPKIRLSCPAPRALCPLRHEQSHRLCTLPADRDLILGFTVVLAILEAPRKAIPCQKSAPGSAGSLRKGSCAKEEGLAPIPKAPGSPPALLICSPPALGEVKILIFHFHGIPESQNGFN